MGHGSRSVLVGRPPTDAIGACISDLREVAGRSMRAAAAAVTLFEWGILRPRSRPSVDA
jgi:hypothetical protein